MALIVGMMRAWPQHNRRSRHLLVGDLPEEMVDAVEPAFFLSTASTIHQGAAGIAVRSSMASFARVY
jgi:hypothetical protein